MRNRLNLDWLIKWAVLEGDGFTVEIRLMTDKEYRVLISTEIKAGENGGLVEQKLLPESFKDFEMAIGYAERFFQELSK